MMRSSPPVSCSLSCISQMAGSFDCTHFSKIFVPSELLYFNSSIEETKLAKASMILYGFTLSMQSSSKDMQSFFLPIITTEETVIATVKETVSVTAEETVIVTAEEIVKKAAVYAAGILEAAVIFGKVAVLFRFPAPVFFPFPVPFLIQVPLLLPKILLVLFHLLRQPVLLLFQFSLLFQLLLLHLQSLLLFQKIKDMVVVMVTRETEKFK